MALQPVAVLGLEGWVNIPGEKMDNLFMHFVEANYSQSTLARGQAYSFQRILADNQQNPTGITTNLESALSTYFRGYFASVDVQVSVISDPTVYDALILQVYLSASDEYGKQYNLAKQSSNINSKTIKWANLNNYGSTTIFNQ